MTEPAGGAPTEAGDLRALLALAEAIALAAGDTAAHYRAARGVSVMATKSSPTDVVTAADTAVEAQIRAAVAQARPDDAVIGEEGDDAGGTSGLRWVVDPIDGTVNYLYGHARYAVSIGVEDTDGGLVAVVHAPATGETWTAARGLGAWLDGSPITTSDCDALGDALVATGFGYRADRRARQAAVLADVLPRVRDIRRAGAASLDLCDVACGRLDGYYEQGLQPWDLAAGRLIVTEAGGVVTGLRGRAPSDAVVVAAGARLHPALAELLTSLDADRPS
ncbi:MAG: inositol monophosphatase family protein [Jiangellales bacterium]